MLPRRSRSAILVAHQSVNYAATHLGSHGPKLAFLLALFFILMSIVPRCFQHQTIGAVDRRLRRCSCRNLHHNRMPYLGYEYESRADVQFRSWRSHLDVTVDLFCRAASRNVVDGGVYRRLNVRRPVACAKPYILQQQALHLPIALELNNKGD